MSAKSDQFWVDIFKPKWNLSYIDGDRRLSSIGRIGSIDPDPALDHVH